MAITKFRQSQVKNLIEDLILIKEQIKTFKPPVDLVTNLPLTYNNDGDMRVCLEDGNIYVWNDINKEWNLSSGKGGTYTKTIILPVNYDGQKEFETGIRFDETGTLQTNNLNVALHINGLLVNQGCYKVKNVDEQMIIEWIDQDKLLVEDELSLTYYDTLGIITSSSSNKVDLSIYATTEQMNDAIADAIGKVDLSAYPTTEQMTVAITNEIQKIDFSEYITNETLEAKGYAKIKYITQTDYDNLDLKNPNIIYIITD